MTRNVSVLINNYNYARYLRHAIDSVLKQTYPQIELVVVDDGSTDESREILLSYGPRIRLVLKENGGQASAINAAFAASTGKILCLLDADDYYSPEAVERIVASWDDNTHILHHRLQAVDNEGRRGGFNPDLGEAFEPSTVIPLLMSQGCYASPPTSGLVYSRTLLEKILPMPEASWRICADSYLVTVSPFFAPVAMMPESVAYYRRHGSNAFDSFGGSATCRTIRRSILERHTNLTGLRHELVEKFGREKGLPPPTLVQSDICFYRLLLYRSGPYNLRHAATLYGDLLRHLWREPAKFGLRLKRTLAGTLLFLGPRVILRSIYVQMFSSAV